jgi:glycosyltransferase involved in cell wall biosynthesis
MQTVFLPVKLKTRIVNDDLLRQQFDKLHACVIIPTYNNAASLAGVISDVAAYTHNIIVVNDGSTDDTKNIFQLFSFVQSVSYEKNTGKGWALRKGLKFATEKGYEFAITIDADGQHFAKDLVVFINKLESVKDAIIIGARNMDQSSVPGKSSFGNRFSNFWFKVETGITVPDTQSGYRLYPLLLLKNISFITRKYEFEIEVLVRAAWKGVKVESVPVSVYYPPASERVSHFRPFKDFTRISILNTFLVLITFLYIKPRDFFRAIFNKEKGKEYINKHLLQIDQPDHIKALSVGFGVFMGIVPIWGFQLIVAISLSILFKLNKALVILAAHISIIPMIPVIIFLSYKAGAYWMGTNAMHIEFSRHITLMSIKKNFEQYLYGSITLAIGAGILSGLVTFLLLKLFKRKPVTTA